MSIKLKSWIITRDSDFENLLKFKQHDTEGIIVLKTKITITAYLVNLFKSLLEKNIIMFSQKQLIVIDEEGINIIKP